MSLPLGQLIFTPAVCATFAHLSISALMKSLNSSGVMDSRATPCLAQLSSINARVEDLVDLGVEEIDYRLGRPGGRDDADPPRCRKARHACLRDRWHVRNDRRALQSDVPSAFTNPTSTLGFIVEMVSNIIWTCPPMMSLRAPALLLYGTWTMSVPDIVLKSSPSIWYCEPVPEDA